MESFSCSKAYIKKFKVFGHIGLNNSFTLVNTDMKSFLDDETYKEYIEALDEYRKNLEETKHN